MKKFITLVSCVLLFTAVQAQEKKGAPAKRDLPALKACMLTAQQNLPLFTQSLADPAQAHDVNSIIKDIELYIDSMPKSKTYSDELLMKHFAPLRHFFLTTTNKTTVAAEFLYTDAPYRFCMYNDTALALYVWAVKDGDTYNLSKMTEKHVAKLAFENCLLPSLAALDEFKDNDIKYIALSIYYGCKDTREGAPGVAAVPYCLTLVARLADIQQFAAGLITAKGLMTNAEVYIADADDVHNLKM